MAEKYKRIPSYITTFSGLHIDPLDLQVEDVSLTDIAHHLAMQCRWSGAVRYHYSVAQHAYYVSLLAPPDEAYDALHHDDAEYALQDMAKPLKNHVTLGQAYRGAEARIERVIVESNPESTSARAAWMGCNHDNTGEYDCDHQPCILCLGPWARNK